ncbi:MAG: DegT/DnrJ/EryC1/StrS family aminotransferase [Gemmatimonadota bacterium]|nr:DegT/DnrJ/EryC1/StrS family aminotransferase [Gemmatimonadota bacterium]
MTAIRYPVTEPHLDENDRSHLLDAFDSGWISSQGPYLERFERDFAAFAGTAYALATCNGTTALHLALMALNLKPGDEVIVPTFTYIASANAVHYCGATPVFVDCSADTWNMDPAAVEAAITTRTVGIMPVHLYGMPCDMLSLAEIANRHSLWLVEDAAEAHGATVQGKRVGSLSTIASFSLFGNKIMTTGEGGVVTTDDPELATRMALLRGQGMDPARRYWFPTVGYNYRMTNLAAALGVSQLAKVEHLIAAHQQVHAWYREALGDMPSLAWQGERADTMSVQWLTSIRLRSAEHRPNRRDELMARLRADGIDTRPFFYPMHSMPPYASSVTFPIAEAIASSGINVPSSPRLTRDDVFIIADRIRHHADVIDLGDVRGDVFAGVTVAAPDATVVPDGPRAMPQVAA